MSPRTTRRATARLLAALLAAPVLAVGLAGPAAAHPLGNSSTNLSSELRVAPDRVVVDHLTDLAEIRTVQLLPTVDTDGDGEVSPAEGTAYAATACAEVAASTTLTVEDRAATLTPQQSSLEFFPGQGGLQVTRLGCTLDAPVNIEDPTRIDYLDESYPDRFGWREVTAVFDGTTPVSSDVPEESSSDRLRSYPADGALDDLPDVRSASLQVRPGGPSLSDGDTSTLSVPGALPGIDRLTGSFTDLLKRTELTVGFGVLMVLLSVVLGAGHALAPGHGKTVMAAYLVGQEGTPRQALVLGGVVTFTHTVGVLALGILTVVYTTLATEALVIGLQVLSGVLLAAVGGYLLWRAVSRRRVALARLIGGGSRAGGHGHDHGHDGHGHGGHGHGHGHGHGDGHEHGHEHGHPHEAGHSHPPTPATADVVQPSADVLIAAPAAVTSTEPEATTGRVVAVDHDHGFGRHTHVLPDPAKPLGMRSIAALGVAGGLVPSPSAILVLLAANLAGRAWFGVVLVIAYGLGMAITLSLAGLALLRARRMIDASMVGRRFAWLRSATAARLLAALPVLTAVVIVVVGVVLAVRGLLVAGSIG